MADRRQQIAKILQEFRQGVSEDFSVGRDERQRAYYAEREALGKQAEGPKVDSLMGTHQGLTRLQEAIGNISPQKKASLEDAEINLRGSTAHKAGQFVGSMANDLANDGTRAIYWLINAPQATADIIQEKVVASKRFGEPALYEKSPVLRNNSQQPLNRNNRKHHAEMIKRGLGKQELDAQGKIKVEPTRGYSFDEGGELIKRNYRPGTMAALSVPTGIAINNAIGLLTPFGGAEGYKATIPSSEDPTETDNAVLEVALKYFMGRSGNLLPYDEFNKVRPDVSPEEYGQYQGYRYNKREDWNPLDDGKVSMLNGFVRGTDEGIHGPEVQMMGRSIPLTTGLTPAIAAIAGTAAGARLGHRRFNNRGVIGGFGGGMTGLAVGSAVGNIIEGERRRRNALENEQDGSL